MKCCVYRNELCEGTPPRNPSARPKNGSALSQKESTKKKARKDEPPPKPWLVAGIRVRVGRDGDALFRKKGRVLDVLLSADGKRRATLALDGGGRVDEPGYKERYLETRSKRRRARALRLR